MKTKITALCLGAGIGALLFCAGCATTDDLASATVVTTTQPIVTTTGTATLVVTFNHPEKFTDMKTSQMGSDKDRAGLMDDIRDYLVEQAPRYLGAGQTFSVTFNDIDMAGEYEPWHGPAMQDVRIIKEIYPPRIALDFSLKDAGGAVVASGTRKLADTNFLNSFPVTVFRDDRLLHEKTLLHNWLEGEFVKPKQGH